MMEKQGYRENLELLRQHFPGKVTLSVKETAAILGVSTNIVYDMARYAKNPLPHQKAGARVLIPIAGLARWMCG